MAYGPKRAPEPRGYFIPDCDDPDAPYAFEPYEDDTVSPLEARAIMERNGYKYEPWQSTRNLDAGE